MARIESAHKSSRLEFTELLSERQSDERIFEYSFQSPRQYNGQVQEMFRMRYDSVIWLYHNLCLPNFRQSRTISRNFARIDAPAAFYQNPHEHIEETTTGSDSEKILICIGHLSHGFKNYETQVALFTEDDLFGESRAAVQTRTAKLQESFYPICAI